MENLAKIIAEQSRRILELEEYLNKPQIKPKLPSKVQKIIDLSMRTKYSKKPFKKLDEYWKIEASFYDDEFIKQKILKARLQHGAEKFNKHIKMYCFNNITSELSIYKYLDKIYKQEDKAFKILISFGYVTENITTGKVRLFAPTQQYFFDHPIVIKNSQDINTLKHQIDRESIVQKISQRFPDSQTRLLGVYAMGVKVIRLDFPIGAKITLPHYIKVSKFINGLEEVDNNLCFWACMAMAHGCRKDRYMSKAKELFYEFYNVKKT